MKLIRPAFIALTLFFIVMAVSQNLNSAEPPPLPPVLLQMIRDDAVHQELELQDQQKTALLQLLPSIDGPWLRSRNLPMQRQQQELSSITRQTKTELAGILSDSQQKRLDQLERQALGTRMFLRDDIAAELQLTPRQINSFTDTFASTDSKSRDLQKKNQSGNNSSADTNAELEKLKIRERQKVINQLTAVQKSQLGTLTGSPFDFSRVRRMYPMAPEFSLAGVTWIQGGPLTLQELRGKVVAIHFYAFQCINCQRNLPHYQGWDNDYRDDGLVIIGIQTPETPAERKLDRVTAAMESNGMRYPVLLDGNSSNWTIWSNTMWPTVYLIDKQGFIRRWWQGELNWQGATGEQQMRQTIEQLLAETP